MEACGDHVRAVGDKPPQEVRQVPVVTAEEDTSRRPAATGLLDGKQCLAGPGATSDNGALVVGDAVEHVVLLSGETEHVLCNQTEAGPQRWPQVEVAS